MHTSSIQTPFAADAVEIADQQQSQWNFRIDRGSARGLQKVLQLFPYESEIDVAVDYSQQMIGGDLLFQTEILEQRLSPALLTHPRRCSSLLYAVAQTGASHPK